MLKIIIIFCCTFGFIKAQVIEVNFYLLDKNSLEKVEFAFCYLKESKISTMSNENGFLSFHIPSKYNFDTLFFQHLSYNSHKIKIDEINDTIFLERKDVNLNEVSIYALGALKIVENIIKNIPQNYNQKSHYNFGKYRQIHLENSIYTRFIEAFCFVHFEEMSYKNQKENFLISEMRRSYNFERSGEQHGDHLVELFLENPLRYPSKSFLNQKNINKISWELENEDEQFYWILFQNKSSENTLNYYGKLKINKSDFAILYFEINSTPSIFYNTKSNWKLITDYVNGSFIKTNDFYELASLKRNYVHEIYNDRMQSIESIIEERFIWETYNDKKDTPTQGYKKFTKLYNQRYTYQPQIWENIKIDDAIVNDLTRNKSLETQFQNK